MNPPTSFPSPEFKPKKSVALSGVVAGHTAICTVGHTGNDLHYRGYDIADLAAHATYEEVAHLLIHERLPTAAELTGYAARLHEIHNAQFSGMSFDRFKEKVQTVRDEELIARWKLECSKKTVYRLKDAPEGEVKDFTLAQTEEFIRTRIAEAEIEEVTRAVLPSALARKIKDYNLIRMVREAWERESRFPMSVSFALRAAFRHLHLQTFKAGRNINFVTSVKPDPINPEKTVKHIRAVLEYLAAHPGSTRDKMVEELRPGAEKDSEAVREILNPLRWLIEKGHIIEFFNGTLAVPSHRQRR
jgi:hypothetical protein